MKMDFTIHPKMNASHAMTFTHFISFSVNSDKRYSYTEKES